MTTLVSVWCFQDVNLFLVFNDVAGQHRESATDTGVETLSLDSSDEIIDLDSLASSSDSSDSDLVELRDSFLESDHECSFDEDREDLYEGSSVSILESNKTPTNCLAKHSKKYFCSLLLTSHKGQSVVRLYVD